MIAPSQVVHVIEAPGSGGTEVYVDALVRYLAPQIPQRIITLDGSQAQAEARFVGCDVQAAGGLMGFARMVRHLPPGTLIQFHLYSRLLPAALLVRALRQRAVSVLVTLHQPLANWSWRHRLGWRLALRLADGTACVSGAVLDGVAGCIGPRPARVIAGPLPDALLRTEVSAPAARPNRFRVAGAGRLAREKGWETLIAATAALPGAELVILGEGPMRAALQDDARAAGIVLSLPGSVDQSALFAALKDADVFVLPSRFEGLGLAAIEAMALGLPVITADFRAAADYIVPGRTGFTFPGGDAMALAGLLSDLRADPDLRCRIGAAGAAHARGRFTPAAQFGQYPALFSEVVRCGS